MNWGWLFIRIAVMLSVLTLLVLSQRFWHRALWRVTSNWGRVWLRVALRLAYILVLLLVIAAAADAIRMNHRHLIRTSSLVSGLAGLWFSSALFAYLGVKSIHGLDRGWHWLGRRHAAQSGEKTADAGSAAPPAVEILASPGRRYFFQTATAVAGAAPFFGVMYGFAAERLKYQVRRIEVPLAHLPPALDGMKIAQISDIHLSGYMTREQVRRAVDMANELAADLAVVTGDFITGANDPLADCIEELRALRAPLGVWGCNGNHEIYAKAEDAAQLLFAQAGMKLLRQESAQLSWRGAQFNLIGMDYQRERTPSGRRLPMLVHAEPLVRRDMPNILLSHNPNSFHRAAELGIELTLSGHTHGGQVQVEILDHRFSPARFITDYIAGLYQRPLFAPAGTGRAAATLLPAAEMRLTDPSPLGAALYVNRGLGTVGAPVRLGVPPEITLLVLRRA
ncbi:MAG: metallophosphoesterase [Acidobacteriia bacterium]|nr:metallophosphoesterase [Terriglobia bacterium]